MPYYGDADLLKHANRNLFKGLPDVDIDASIAFADGLVVHTLEGHLHSIFVSWPDPDDTNQNVISHLWMLLCTEHLQKTSTATNTTGTPSAFGNDVGEQFTSILNDLKAGRIVVPGAYRHSDAPVGTGGIPPRFIPEEVNEQRTVQSYFPKGLRT